MLYVIQNDSRVPAGWYGEVLREREMPHRTLHSYAGDTFPALSGASGIIILGGYMGVHDGERHPFLAPLGQFMKDAVAADAPLLGICLGGQLLAHVFGGEVRSRYRRERGMHRVRLTAAGQDDPLFAGFPPVFTAFEWHNDSFDPPPGALHLAATSACPGQAFRCRNAWGLQFHPEVDREIVEAWSRLADPGGPHPEAFAAGEAEHRAMARLLLENFLKFAGRE